MRHTMLYGCWGWDLPRFTKLECRKDIDLTNNIAVSLKLTRRAAIIAPLGFVAIPAGWASLRRVVFVLQHYGDPFCFCFVLNKLSDLTVIPSAHFLVSLFAKIDFIGNVLNIDKQVDSC